MNGTTDFDAWLQAQYADTGPFTALMVLVSIDDQGVKPLLSSYVNVIGDELTWPEMFALLRGAPGLWDGVAFYIGLTAGGGPLSDAQAKIKLQQVEADVKADPLHLNIGRLFDRNGSHLEIRPRALHA